MPEDVECITRRNGEIEPLVSKCAILPQTVKVQQFSALGARTRCPLLLENLMDHGRIKAECYGKTSLRTFKCHFKQARTRFSTRIGKWTAEFVALSQLTLHVSFGAQAPQRRHTPSKLCLMNLTRCSHDPRPITTDFISHATT